MPLRDQFRRSVSVELSVGKRYGNERLFGARGAKLAARKSFSGLFFNNDFKILLKVIDESKPWRKFSTVLRLVYI